MSPGQANNGSETTVVRRGRVDSVDLYEVKEHELEILENGASHNNSSLFLNFSIFLLSTAVSFTLTLVTTSTFKQAIYEVIVIVVMVVSYIIGLFLFLLWLISHRREKKHVRKVITIIKDRINCTVTNTIETVIETNGLDPNSDNSPI